MTSDALSTQALNRALLARQRLLARVPLAANRDRAGHVIRMVEHLARLQAQAPFPPYYPCIADPLSSKAPHHLSGW